MSDHSITSLIEKLEGAEVGSRELNAKVCDATNPHDSGPYVHAPSMMRAFGYASEVTTSLDAALALAERVLPGWRMHFLQDQDGIYQTDNTATRWAVGIRKKRGPGNVQSKAATPALALCAAILRAQSEVRV